MDQAYNDELRGAYRGFCGTCLMPFRARASAPDPFLRPECHPIQDIRNRKTNDVMWQALTLGAAMVPFFLLETLLKYVPDDEAGEDFILELQAEFQSQDVLLVDPDTDEVVEVEDFLLLKVSILTLWLKSKILGYSNNDENTYLSFLPHFYSTLVQTMTT